MSSVAKAAIISAVLFVLLIAAVVYLKSRPQAPALVEQGGSIEAPAAPAAEPGSSGGRPTDMTPTARETTELTIEVLEKGRDRRLAGSRAMVLHGAEGERMGKRAWESDRNSTGLFTVQLEPGVYNVRVQCPRFKGETRKVTLIKDQPQTIAFQLERGNSISGRILAQGGAPIGGARVTAHKELAAPGASQIELLMGMIDIQNMANEVSAETVSADDGSYQLDGLGLNAFTVRAVATGYTPNEVTEVPAPRSEVDVLLAPGGEVSGVVLDTNGSPVPNAEVAAYQELDSQNVFKIIMVKARPPVDKATSDGSGRFVFQTLGSGLFNFLIQAPGFQRSQETKIRVVAGETKTLSFTLKPGFQLTGVVTGPSQEPVSGARVRATATGAVAVSRPQPVNISFDDESVITNDQGEFRLDTLEEGTYMVLCWHPDYKTLRRNDVRVHSQSDELELKLSYGGRIKGLVLDHVSGKPVAGARVNAADVADLHKDVVTQEDGTFVLSGLGGNARGVSVSVAADGFSRVRRDVKVDDGREVEETFELQATAKVNGVVVNSAGDPVRGVRVMAKRQQENSGVEQAMGSALTDSEGKFTIEGIDPGENNWLVANKGEYLEAVSETFAAASGESVDVQPIRLALGGAVAGRVVGPQGAPISGCMVVISGEGDTEITRAGNPSSETNANGEFKIQGLPAGTVDLVVKAGHYLEKTVPGVVVEEGAIHANIEIALEQGQAVSGRVVDQAGAPVAAAEIVVRDFAQGLKELRGSSVSDGRFTIDGIVATDVVEIEVSHPSYAGYSSENVRVGSSDLQVVLKELGGIRGVVVGPGGEAVDTFTVQAQSEAAQRDPRKAPKAQTFTPTGGDGAFEYRGIASGVYTVNIRSPQFSAASIPAVAVADGEVVDLGKIVLEAGGVVFGKVVDGASGLPIAGARVQITQGSSRFIRSAAANIAGASTSPVQTTGADGGFRFTNLKGGSLSLRISQDGYVTSTVNDVNPDSAPSSQNLVLELSQGGEITGQVLGADGKARAGMTVYLMGEDPGTNASTATDRDGRFRFQGVPAGNFTVKAHRFGTQGAPAEQAESPVALGSGDVQQVVLRVE